MEILDHVSAVRSLMQESVPSAMRMMADTPLVEFFNEEVLIEAYFDPLLASMFSLASLDEDAGNLPKAVRKDRRKMQHLQTMTAHIYSGVPQHVARWGHEAHAEGLRAFGMERSSKATPQRKMQAHHDASQAHMLASHHMSRAGHKTAAELHQRAAEYHRSRKAGLSQQHGIAATESKNRGSRFMEMARLRRAKKKSEHAASSDRQPDYSVQFPKAFESIQNWAADLDEAGYSDDVKRASKIAADATGKTKERGATGDHHDAAARLHFIAHGVAKAHGHHELAAKHMDFVSKHRSASQQARAAS